MSITTITPDAIKPCLPAVVLRAYKRDDISDNQMLDVIESHLSVCQHCESVYEGIPETGILDGYLRNVPITTVDAAAQETNSSEIGDLPLSVLQEANWHWIGLLGKGGGGQVYLCRNRTSGLFEAVKVIRTPNDADRATIDRVCREARMTQLTPHPNVVRMQSPIRIGSSLLLPMQLILGEDLERIAMRHGDKIPAETVCQWMDQALDALIYAAEQGVIHRDIKPANFILGHDGLIRMLDFGLAKISPLQDGLDLTLTVMGKCGTPGYMSPEQSISLKSADARSDLYSLGCTIYRLISGHPPFGPETGEKSYEDVLEAHRQKIPTPLHELEPDTPRALSDLVQKLLAKDASQRYESAKQVQVELRRIGTDVPEASALEENDYGSKASADQSLPRSRVLIALGLLGVFLALSGIVFAIQTKAGEVIIQVDSPTVEIAIDDRPVKATKIGISEDGMNLLQIKATRGKHRLKLTENGESVWSDDIQVGLANNRRITVRLQPKEEENQAKVAALPVDQPAAEPMPPKEEPLNTQLTLEERKEELRKHLVAYDWFYFDSLYPPGDIARFRPNGKFHKWNWNYWILDERSFHVQFWDPDYKPETAVLFQMNDDRTEFYASFPEPDGRVHRVRGTQREGRGN